MNEPLVPCRCGNTADTIVVLHGCIIELCGQCARRVCDPIGAR